MNVTEIPFNKFLSIAKADEYDQVLELDLRDDLKNHLGTFHASAQFALAEACSGLALQKHFSHLADSVLPVLRKSEVKFKKPAQSGIRAQAAIEKEEIERFEQQFEKKGRATIAVPVEVMDRDGMVTMTGVYEWYVQRL